MHKVREIKLKVHYVNDEARTRIPAGSIVYCVYDGPQRVTEPFISHYLAQRTCDRLNGRLD